MSEVTLTINGRDYKVRARDGEEAQLERAGALVDERCKQARASLGDLSDNRLFFYVALMLADDLAAGRTAPESEDEALAARAETLADRLDALASRLEKLGDSA